MFLNLIDFSSVGGTGTRGVCRAEYAGRPSGPTAGCLEDEEDDDDVLSWYFDFDFLMCRDDDECEDDETPRGVDDRERSELDDEREEASAPAEQEGEDDRELSERPFVRDTNDLLSTTDLKRSVKSFAQASTSSTGGSGFVDIVGMYICACRGSSGA